LIKIVVSVKVMMTTQNNHKRVLYKHCLKGESANCACARSRDTK